MKLFLRKDILILFSFLTLFTYELLFELPATSKTINYYFPLLILSILALFFLSIQTSLKEEVPRFGMIVFKLMLYWQVLSFIRAALTVEEYIDYSILLVNKLGGLSIFIPLAFYVGINYKHSKKMLLFVLISFIAAFSLIPLSLKDNEAEVYLFSRNITPIITFIVFSPYLHWFWVVLILIEAIVSAWISLIWRANILRTVSSYAATLVYFAGSFINYRWINAARIILFLIPIYFIIIGLRGDNVFSSSTKGKEIDVRSKGGEEENLAQDTRTGLYTEVLEDLYESGDIWFGRGATGKYRTYLDFELPVELGDMRPDVEVGALKILLYHGLVGLILYTIVLLTASYYGICKTNNKLSQMLGLLIMFHWVILFIENILTYNPYYYFHWFVIGLCMSTSFRNQDEKEVKAWLNFGLKSK
jgi:hypothetical protein